MNLDTIIFAETILTVVFLLLLIVYFVLAGIRKKKLLKIPGNEKKSLKYNIIIAVGAGVLMTVSSFLLFTVIDNYIIGKVLAAVDFNHDDMYCNIDELGDTFLRYNTESRLTEAEAISKYGREAVEECKVLRHTVNDTGRNLCWIFMAAFSVLFCPILFGLLCLKDRLLARRGKKDAPSSDSRPEEAPTEKDENC